MHKLLVAVLLVMLIVAGVYVAWPTKYIHVVPVPSMLDDSEGPSGQQTENPLE